MGTWQKSKMLFLSLISLGFLGGFTHCIGMCGPFVITQTTTRLARIPLEKFSGFTRLKNLALLPYHLGRITTYSLIGFFCSFFSQVIQDFSGFQYLSATLLLLAALSFFFTFKSPNLQGAPFFPQKLVSHLFQDPHGFRGYLLGLILGFIPCGLLYSAFLIAAAMSNPFMAAIGMFCFGLATFPSLFLTACGSAFLQKFPEFKIIAKTLILLNGIMLVLMAIKLIY
ncbi:MAG: sulfite exporter TauE/SafE family protein [Alphaproteobacteria bacterium]|nr:sulfite exporter TauE/SafE family protein [Alphaproteobacteria bacterium]